MIKKILLLCLISSCLYAQTATKITIDELESLLDNNAYRTKLEYTNKEVELTGTLYLISIDGEYIGLIESEREDFDFDPYTVRCNITDDIERQKILDMNDEDIITVQGTFIEIANFEAEFNVSKIVKIESL